MTAELLAAAAVDAELAVRSEEERLIDIRLMPWGETGNTSEGRERFRRGAFRGTRPEHVVLEAIGAHGDQPGVVLAGRAVSIEERDDGAYGTFRVARTRAGDELLELAREGVYRGASVVFQPIKSRRAGDGVIERELVSLWRVGLVERGAYAGAGVLAVRNEETSPMPETTVETMPETETPPAVRMTRDDPELMARLEEIRTDLVGRMLALEARGARTGNTAHPLAGYGRLVDYADAAFSDATAGPLLARALVDQTTALNPGVVPPAWLPEIVGILARPRPAISALGGPRGLGDSGMEIDWPYLDPALSLDAIVAKQATEKSEINSVLVKFLKGTAPISTWAGGSDVSYQLIRRSKPSYREAYLRILLIAYSRETEAEFEAVLAAAATSSLILTATATADAVRSFLFAASAIVEDNTGSPATVDLVSPTEWLRLGGLAGLFPSQYGTGNISGTADAATLRIEISGLPIVRAPFLTGNTHLVTNAEAAHWHEDGPFPISSEDVAKLGQNVAVWGMGAAVVQIPKAIVKSTLTMGEELGAPAAAVRDRAGK